MGFGSFNSLCNHTSLPLCQVLANSNEESKLAALDAGIVSVCYARSIELANTVIFQIANAFVNIGFLFILLIILYNIRSKYTAIGRLEFSFYFHIVLALVISTLIVDCGVSPPGSSSYPYFVAVQLGLASASCWCLMICGFLGFQAWEDGSFRSMLFIRLSSLVIGLLTFLISLFTFHEWVSNETIDRDHPLALFIVAYVFNGVFLGVYLISQVILALHFLKNYWVLGVIALSMGSFVCGQILVYTFSRKVCEGVKHYLDGLFFGSLCNLFSSMMLYKFWDMTTDDDLEFSIGINRNGDVK